jgi:hypothetical protein
MSPVYTMGVALTPHLTRCAALALPVLAAAVAIVSTVIVTGNDEPLKHP